MGDFDLKIWLKKLGYGIFYSCVVATLAYIIDTIELTEFPPDYAFYAALVLVILKAMQNLIKHEFFVES